MVSNSFIGHFFQGLLAVVCLLAVGYGCAGESKEPLRPSVSTPAKGFLAVDFDELAERIVGGTAKVREGDIVQVVGTVEDNQLMEALAIAVRQRGAFPLLTLTSERLERRMYEKVAEKYDDQPPKLELGLAEMITVLIELVPESDEFYPGVPPERIARVFAGREPLHARHRQRGVRQVFLGNELYPSRSRAERYGMPFEDLARNYWRGLAADASVLGARAAWLTEKLESARVIQVTNRNGTDITMSIAGRRLVINDGLLSDEELKAGGSDVMVWLPAGEIYSAPPPGSVNGTVVVDRLLFQDTRVEGLRLDFVKGRVTSMSAKAGLGNLKRFYDAAGAGKDVFSVLDIGINPNVESVPGAWITSPVVAGMVTLGIGGNAWAGGDNDVSFGVPLYLPGSTLSVDGNKIIIDGKLVLPSELR